MPKKRYITWAEVFTHLEPVDCLGAVVYGVPKGGMIAAGFLKNATVTHDIHKANLILDDLIDSGKTRSMYEKVYPEKPFVTLFDKSDGSISFDEWLVFPWERDHPAGEDTIQQNVTRQLQYIGEDPNRQGLRDTPKRIEKMYKELFRGYSDPPPVITCFSDESPRGLITDKGYFFSMCEHHMVPFFGHYYFGYIPDPKGVYLGASKPGRTVDYFAARLQTQERLVKNVLDHIEAAVKPLGSILLMSGRHLCKEMRGLKKWDSPFEVIEARGILLENKGGCKDEFMARLASRI